MERRNKKMMIEENVVIKTVNLRKLFPIRRGLIAGWRLLDLNTLRKIATFFWVITSVLFVLDASFMALPQNNLIWAIFSYLTASTVLCSLWMTQERKRKIIFLAFAVFSFLFGLTGLIIGSPKAAGSGWLWAGLVFSLITILFVVLYQGDVGQLKNNLKASVVAPFAPEFWKNIRLSISDKFLPAIKRFFKSFTYFKTWKKLLFIILKSLPFLLNLLWIGFLALLYAFFYSFTRFYNTFLTAEGIIEVWRFLDNFFRPVELFVHAVDDVSFNIHRGETFGLVGESGCGKSTTGVLILQLLEKTSGEIYFKGIDTSDIHPRQMKKLRKDIQIIFQSPYESLSPRFSVLDIIAEPLRLMKILTDEYEIEKRVLETLEQVDLVPAADFIDRFPHELSGGQRQRVGVARAFIVDPEFIVADEPVSMLDVSIRVGVLKIMKNLSLEKGTAFLFITHDLALARVMTDRIAVMYLGRIVEQGPTEEVIQNPLHPYTKALIAAVPDPDPDARRTEELPIIGEVPSGIHIPIGCRFNPRCIYAIDRCEEVDPVLEEAKEHHLVACIRFREINKLPLFDDVSEYQTEVAK